MECKEIMGLIAGHVDGELTPAQFQMVDRHVASCVDCRATANAHLRLKGLVGAMKREDPPAEPLARIRAEFDAIDRRERLRAVGIRALSATAAAAVILVVFALVFLSGDNLPRVLADSLTLHQDYVAGKKMLAVRSEAAADIRKYFKEHGGIEIDVPVMAPARLVGGCPCDGTKKSVSPWIVYDCDGTPLSLMMFEEPLPEIPSSVPHRAGDAEYRTLTKGEWTIILCQSGRISHVWISSLPEERMIEVVRSTAEGKRLFEGVTVSVAEMGCGACCSRVESVACGVKGVSCVKTDLARKEAVITVENPSVDINTVLEALRRAGYTVTVKSK